MIPVCLKEKELVSTNPGNPPCDMPLVGPKKTAETAQKRIATAGQQSSTGMFKRFGAL